MFYSLNLVTNTNCYIVLIAVNAFMLSWIFHFLESTRVCHFNDNIILNKSQTYTRDPRPPILPCLMVSSAMGLNLGVFRFLPTTHRKNTNKCVHDLCAPRNVLCMSVFTIRPQYMQVTCTWRTMIILIMGKNLKTPCGIKMAQVLGSLVYICGINTLCTTSFFKKILKLPTLIRFNIIISFLLIISKNRAKTKI